MVRKGLDTNSSRLFLLVVPMEPLVDFWPRACFTQHYLGDPEAVEKAARAVASQVPPHSAEAKIFS
jgi:hypothetical protein